MGDLLRNAGLVPQSACGSGAEEDAVRSTQAGIVVSPVDLSTCGKVVIRRQRKGHGGRTVTLIEGLGLGEAAMIQLAREISRALGCGARAEVDVVAVQGDPGERLEDWLRSKGVLKVVRGS